MKKCAVKKCAVKSCRSLADPRWFVYDMKGGSHQSCDGCGGRVFQVSEIERGDDGGDEAEQECATCGGEGTVEVGPECTAPISECCGGCFRSEPCPDCDEEEVEPEGLEYEAEDYETEGDVEWETRS